MSKKNTQRYILFDIDSSSIGVAVFEFSQVKDKFTRKTIFSTRESIDVGLNTDIHFFLEKTISVFYDIATKAYKRINGDTPHIFLNISSPWLSSQKRIVHFEKDKEFIFTKEIEDTIIENELREPLHHTLDFKDYKNLEIVERKTIDIYQNGYPTKRPFGKKIQDVDIHSLVSVMSTEVKEKFVHVIERVFHVDNVIFVSNIFMTYTSLLSMYPNEDNFVHFDMSAKLTEIMVVINDHLYTIGTIPVGSDYIVKTLAEMLNIPFIKAESLIIMYQHNNLEQKYRETIHYAMKETFTLWFRHFYGFLDKVSLEEVVPSTLSIIAPDFIEDWLTEWILRMEDLTEHIHAHQKVSVLDLKSKLSHDTNDINLALCLEFLAHFFKERQ